MALRLFRTFLFAMLTIALLGPSPSQAGDKEFRSTITLTSNRDNPLDGEVYLISPDADTNPNDAIICPADSCDLRQLTDNDVGDGFAVISPDGKKIVFDRLLQASGDPLNTSDLYVMNADGTEQTFLARGSSATWSPDSKFIAYHASASGTAKLINSNLPGSATEDSDIFVANVDDCLEHGEDCRRNLTNNGAEFIDEDPDWSPDGQQIVFGRADPPPRPLTWVPPTRSS